MNKYIEQAYYLGYKDGKFDGYHSTLIEEGLCDRKDSTDELPNMNLVSLDEVLEIIDTVNDDLDFGTKEKGVALSIKEKVLALRGGDKE